MAEPPVLAVIEPSEPRRWIAVGTLVALGGLLLFLAFTATYGSLLPTILFIVIGIGAIYLGDRMRRSTAMRLELSDNGLIESSGRVVCRMDEIAEVQRGAFAFKPSNGFMILLKEKGKATWEPGLWWRIGRRIGVGGVTPAAQGKFMADLIALHLRNGTFEVTLDDAIPGFGKKD